MAANIEVKARAQNWEKLHSLAKQVSDAEGTLIEQVDTFFIVPAGRLKLRQLGPDHGELIFYQRPDEAGPKLSEYTITETTCPDSLRDTLAQALGVSGEVRKKRWYFISSRYGGHTRIHLDEVKGLGQYMELEVVLQPGQMPEDGERIAAEFRAALDIRDEDLIDCAYVDLITSHSGGGL